LLCVRGRLLVLVLVLVLLVLVVLLVLLVKLRAWWLVLILLLLVVLGVGVVRSLLLPVHWVRMRPRRATTASLLHLERRNVKRAAANRATSSSPSASDTRERYHNAT
jgi:hypothetical protein